MQGGPSAGGCAPKREAFISQPVGNMFALPSWQLHGTAFANPGLPGYGDIDQDQEDLDPLDPERLARIADPHEPMLSPGDERSDQTNGMEAQKSMTPQGVCSLAVHLAAEARLGTQTCSGVVRIEAQTSLLKSWIAFPASLCPSYGCPPRGYRVCAKRAQHVTRMMHE